MIYIVSLKETGSRKVSAEPCDNERWELSPEAQQALRKTLELPPEVDLSKVRLPAAWQQEVIARFLDPKKFALVWLLEDGRVLGFTDDDVARGIASNHREPTGIIRIYNNRRH